MVRLSPKDPAETKMLVFDFDGELGPGEVILQASVEVAVLAGTDPTPQDMRVGLPIVALGGRRVFQAIGGGVLLVDYHLRCLASTNIDPQLTHLASAKLPVRRL